MRLDMHKVIVERRRANAAFRYHDFRFQRRRIPDPDEPDEIPRHEGMRRPYGWDHKCLNENLSPLRRFLRSRVGRPWDKVYAEMSRNLKAANAVQQHVRDHVGDYVSFGVIVKDGRYCAFRRGGFYRHLVKGDLFVNQAGILCELKRERPPVARVRGAARGR